jgi:outer membrane usher protein
LQLRQRLPAALLLGALLLSWAAYADDGDVPLLVANADLLLEVEINGVRKPDPAVVRNTPADGLLLRMEDLSTWGVRVQSASLAVDDLGQRFVPVTQIQGLRARVDFAHQRLIVTAAPMLLPTADLQLDEDAASAPVPSVPGVFVGYDLLGGYGERARIAAGQLQAGGFAGAWNTSGTWQIDAREGFVGKRLDTTLSRDWPDRMLALRLGDAITTPGYWGRAVRMGGIRWGTDFSARPDFITFPLPAVRGEAAVPSTVDVYVNDSLRARRQVPAGPFSIHDLPVVSGSGEVRLVVRDSLGREQLVQQPYFASEALLRPDLSMYAIEVGAVREDYGLENFDYGRAVVIGTLRRGLTERITAELRGEALAGQQTAGAGLVASVLPSIVVSTSLACSDALSSGTLAQLGVDFNRGALNAGVRVRTATAGFRQVGLAEDESAARRAVDAQVGWLAGRAGSFGFVLADREFRDRDSVRLLSMTYGISLGRALGYLGAFASYDVARRGNSQIAVMLTRALGNRTSSRVSASFDETGVGAGVAINRSLPAGAGVGYHVEAEQGPFGRLGAGAAIQRESATFSVDAERVEGQDRYEAYARGGVVLLGGHVAAVRDVAMESSFAVVEVPSLSGVPIYHDNHRVAVTDAHGFAVLPGLRPYEANRLQIDPNDLPIDAAVASNEYSVRPYRRGGVQVRFPVADRGGAVAHLERESSGEFVPAGAIVRVGAQQFTVAGEGAVYLAGQSGEVTLEASWPGHLCRARVTIPADRVLPDLGVVTCKDTL